MKNKILSLFTKFFLISTLFLISMTAYSQAGNVQFQVATAGSSNITPTSAVLQASFSTDYIGTLTRPLAWIEYGTSPNSFSNTTTPQEFTSRTPIMRVQVNNLQPGTKYYFRAVAQSSAGQKKGNAMEFYTLNSDGSQVVVNNTNTTNNNTNNNTTNNNNTNNNQNNNQSGGGNTSNLDPSGLGFTGTSSLFLSLDDGFETYTEEDILTYTLSARNSKQEDIENVYAVVEIPADLTYLGDSARGVYRPETNEVIFTLGNLDEDDQFTARIDLKPATIPEEGFRSVVKATGYYTDSVEKFQYNTVDFDINVFQLQGNVRLATENTVVEPTEQAEKRSVLAVILIALIVVLLFIIVILLGRKLYLRYQADKVNFNSDIFKQQTNQNSFNVANNNSNSGNPNSNENAPISVFKQTDSPSSFTYNPTVGSSFPGQDSKPGVFDEMENTNAMNSKRDAIEEARKMFQKRAEDFSAEDPNKDRSIPPNLPV